MGKYYQGVRHPFPELREHDYRNRIASCYHEASHAVTALVLADGVSELRGRGGFAHFRLRSERNYSPLVVGTILAAGVIGERKAGYTNFPTPDRLDNEQIFNLGVSITECQRRAARIVNANYDLIRRLATKLLDVSVMTGDEVDNFVRVNGGVVRAVAETTGFESTEKPLLDKQKQTKSKKAKTNGTIEAQDTEDDPNELDEDEEDQDQDQKSAKVVKKTSVNNGQRVVGEIHYLEDGRFLAVRRNGKRVGYFRSSSAASRAL